MHAKDWFALLLFVLGLILAVMVYRVAGEEIRLEWDPADDQTVDGYMLYQSQKDSTFHYDIPVTTSEYPDGKIPPDVTSLDIDIPGIDGSDTRYRFVARAFRGEEFSPDSNEVSYVVSLVAPPAAIDLAGSYDKSAGLVHISWVQPEEEQEYRTISHWIIYYRIRDGDWTPIGRIDSDHELSMDAPFDAIPQGEQADVEFVIVSYRRSGKYSPNSEILTLDIDRRDVPPVQKLRINIEFPVT